MAMRPVGRRTSRAVRPVPMRPQSDKRYAEMKRANAHSVGRMKGKFSLVGQTSTSCTIKACNRGWALQAHSITLAHLKS